MNTNTKRNVYLPGLEIGWRLAAARKKPDNWLICPVCKKDFQRRGKRKTQCRAVCCSVKCRATFQKGRLVQGFNIKDKRGVYLPCPICGETFYRFPGSEKKYCSAKCYFADPEGKVGISGKNHYSWLGGYNNPVSSSKRRQAKFRRAARMAGAVTESISTYVLRLTNDPDLVCYYCHSKITPETMHLDHVQPICKGGAHTVWNIVPTCAFCNLSKHSKMVNEWIKEGQLLLF